MSLEGAAVCQRKFFVNLVWLFLQLENSKYFYEWLCWCFHFLQEYVSKNGSQLLQLYDQDMAIKFLNW